MTDRVLLVDDTADVRTVLRQALRRRGGFEVVGEAGDGNEAIILAEKHQPDLIVLDLGLPDLAGREVLSKLRTVAPAAKVIVFTGTETADRAAVMREADGFVLKDSDVNYLVDLLTSIARKSRFVAVLDVPSDPRHVRMARRFVSARCSEWGCDDAVDEAQLIVSELVTNAVVHAHTPCRVCVRRAVGVVRIEVSDRNPAPPDPRGTSADDENGRGLLLVSSVAVAWGVAPLPEGGKLVWAELLCNDPLPALLS